MTHVVVFTFLNQIGIFICAEKYANLNVQAIENSEFNFIVHSGRQNLNSEHSFLPSV